MTGSRRDNGLIVSMGTRRVCSSEFTVRVRIGPPIYVVAVRLYILGMSSGCDPVEADRNRTSPQFMPRCWNGRHSGLRNRGLVRESSSLSWGTKQ